MARGIFLQPKDLMILAGYSHYNSALEGLNQLKFVLGKQKHQPVTVNEYAKHMGIDAKEVWDAINPSKHTHIIK